MRLSKKLSTFILTAALVVGTSVTAFASPNDDVIKALKDAKVPATYIIQAENYLKTTELTADQATAVTAQVGNAEAILKAAGVKDVTKLSPEDKTKVLTAITEAAKAVDLTVNVTKQSNGKFEVVAKDAAGEVVATFATNQVKQTGLDSTIIYLGALMIILAAGSVFVVKRNSSVNA